MKRIQDPFLGSLRSILSPGIFSTLTQLGTAHKSLSVSITLLKHWADLLYVVKFKQRDAKNRLLRLYILISLCIFSIPFLIIPYGTDMRICLSIKSFFSW